MFVQLVLNFGLLLGINNGLVLQWGRANARQAFNYPIRFPKFIRAIVGVPEYDNATITGIGITLAYKTNLSQMLFCAESNYVIQWIAIGH